ncbi:nuclear transport factor 2 family protein [Actinoplanes sp. LDG1-01]|uniref:Nuclear transport factor 2 family protein n=2 Tax=Paractinoplanes lichenicola TaxID=2802976 RepID=A0ABS1VX61_9ACTN|nr:nuclear transport factor 2 family protein [Actinoplanes lichenicola]
MTHIADDIICDAPAGRLEGAPAYRAFMAGFVAILKSTTVLAAFGNDTTALIMYDTSTHPVPSAPGAELVTVLHDRITYSRFLFDRLPFAQARQPTT